MTAASTLTRPVPVQWPLLSLSLPESSGGMSAPQLLTLLPPEPRVRPPAAVSAATSVPVLQTGH